MVSSLHLPSQVQETSVGCDRTRTIFCSRSFSFSRPLFLRRVASVAAAHWPVPVGGRGASVAARCLLACSHTDTRTTTLHTQRHTAQTDRWTDACPSLQWSLVGVDPSTHDSAAQLTHSLHVTHVCAIMMATVRSLPSLPSATHRPLLAFDLSLSSPACIHRTRLYLTALGTHPAR